VAEGVQVARADSTDAALERPQVAAARMAELLRASAVFAHREARGDSTVRQAGLERAVERYRRTLALFPGAEGEPTTWLYLGEALFESGRYVEAADACASAAAHAAADSTVRASAAGEELAALDAACAQDSTLLERYDHTARARLQQHPGDPHALDALERVGEIAFASRRWEQAASAWTDFATAAPDGRRAATALKAVGDTWWRRDDYRRAAAGYDAALTRARAAGADSLANALAVLVPGALYRAASADEENQRASAAAAGYESVASAHPGFEFADQALYRAAHLRAAMGDTAAAIQDFENIARVQTNSALVPDALLEVGALHAAAGHDVAAAQTYRHFAESQASHPQAQASWLRAGELFEHAGDKEAADSSYAELLRIAEKGAADTLAAGLWVRRARLAGTPEGAAAHYARALEKKAALPAADRAEALFHIADLRRPSYEALQLVPPLTESLPPKQQALEKLLADYAEVVQLGVEPWHAAACLRVGQCLEHLGAALRSSPAPAEFSSADAAAYREALQSQSQVFDDRAADAWSQGLQAAGRAGEQGPWRQELESRLYPVLARVVPTRPTPQFVLTPP
jgi:TolA-binding protein